jgi:RNA polymerase sigma-70 factor (ECF subfamily)
MKHSDEEILELIRNKNTVNKGFRLLMDAYQEKLYHHIMLLTGNHEDSDDVLQNTFVKAYRHIDRFEGRSALYTWLFRIATNEAIQFIESRKKRDKLSDNLQQQDKIVQPVVNAAQTDGEAIKAALESAISFLPPQQKTVFSLRYFEELSYDDLAKITGVSNGALKATYHHAVKKIEKYIRQIAENEIV